MLSRDMFRPPSLPAAAAPPPSGGTLTIGDTLDLQRRLPGVEEGMAVCADDEVQAAHPPGQLQVSQGP